MDADYTKDGVKYVRISRISGKLGKSTDAVTEAVKRLNLDRLIIKIKNKEVTVLPPESVKLVTEYYLELAANRPKKVNYPKNMRNETCVKECMGCVNMNSKVKCTVSIDPGYQWRDGECWIRKLWEG